ncbi:MAG: hypothetical protein U0795_00525 [Pirellulales bacterium]
MINECVVAVYASIEKACEAIHRLTDQGFPADQISLVTAGFQDDPKVMEELQLNDDSMHDAATAAGLGGILGTLAGLSVMVLSGLGVVFLCGPIGGGIVGGIAGAYIGAMAGWGVHEHQISRYQQLVAKGNALVIANGDPLQLAHAHQELDKTTPEELHTYARTEDETAESG